MPLISTVGRRSSRIRLLLLAMYLLLALGGVTMVYPFLLMLSTATTSDADSARYRLVPTFWYDRDELFRKWLVDRALVVQTSYDFGAEDWYAGNQIKRDVIHTALAMPESSRASILADYEAFVKELPASWMRMQFIHQDRKTLSAQSGRIEYYQWLKDKYHGDIAAASERYGDNARKWEDFGMPRGTINSLWEPTPSLPRLIDWQEFVSTRPLHRQRLLDLDASVFVLLRDKFSSIKVLNQTHNTGYTSLSEITWARLRAEPWAERLVTQLLRGDIPLELIRLKPEAKPYWDSFVTLHYAGKGLAYSSEVPIPDIPRAAFIRFIRDENTPMAVIDAVNPAERWRTFLQAKYGSLENLSKDWGLPLTSWDSIRIPNATIQANYFLENRWSLLRSYLMGNFSIVMTEISVSGRALVNTFVLIFLSIAGALTVNPMAAYALSRFKMKYTYHILIFLLATMAFPGEVIMIPGFLQVKQFPLGAILTVGAALSFWWLAHLFVLQNIPFLLSAFLGLVISAAAAIWLPPQIAHLLGVESLDVSLMNTYAALILPGLANAFSVFLLKGFFDSLPPELYEAAILDGASEWRMFWSITLPMSRPVLAVTALGAFSGAYGAFMFAFLTCQDPSMWTLMVYLYQLQQNYSVSVNMASLVIASVPTLLVFLVCQKIILEGIVIPTFK
ncbi:MAG: carbohydrate ABC transporter permease [Verrucomicrobiota bacterium]|nr:carbohydrate ABC transporter permease [Verrucomicrobiota bacterium]